MDFKDFKPEELVGKTVVYERGVTNGHRTSGFAKIVRVTKTGFRIADKDGNELKDRLFDFNGDQKGLSDPADWSTISKCTLITEEQKLELAQKWRTNREIKELKAAIEEHLKRKDGLAPNLEQLKAAAEALGLVKV